MFRPAVSAHPLHGFNLLSLRQRWPPAVLVHYITAFHFRGNCSCSIDFYIFPHRENISLALWFPLGKTNRPWGRLPLDTTDFNNILLRNFSFFFPFSLVYDFHLYYIYQNTMQTTTTAAVLIKLYADSYLYDFPLVRL